MLGYFPAPERGELIYSICARYVDHMGFSTDGGGIESLFAPETHSIGTLFTASLDQLAAKLPAGWGLTADRFIDDHSLLPLLAPFAPGERSARHRALLRASAARRGLVVSLGVAAWMRPGRRLRYCPLCVARERARNGECYWHRQHQVPGVLVCPEHGVLLIESDVRLSGAANPRALMPAERAIGPCDARDGRRPKVGWAVLMRFARDVAWILERNPRPSDMEDLRRRYWAACFRRGLVPAFSPTLYRRAVMKTFQICFPSEVVALLHTEWAGVADGRWLAHLLHRGPHRHPPIRHLLAFQALGCTAEEFFTMAPGSAIPRPTSSPVGMGPA